MYEFASNVADHFTLLVAAVGFVVLVGAGNRPIDSKEDDPTDDLDSCWQANN